MHVNQAFATRVGRTREELLNQPLAEHLGPELGGWLERHKASTTRTHGESAVTIEVVDPVLKGPFMVTVTDLLNYDREPVGSVIVARDLTPQTRLEAEREELRKRLTQSEKLAALGQFVAGIAHELNNPLQGVLGHLELLRTTGAFPKQLRREVQVIYREADRAAKIVRNLLVFAGSRRLTLRSVSLNVVLQKVLALRAPAHRAVGIEVVRHYDEKLPRVKSDPLLLHQVFLNMVMNAEHAIAADRQGRTHRDRHGGVAVGRPDRRHGARHRHRDSRGHAVAHLRAVLHDQGSRQGHRPRAGHHLRHRAGARRPDHRRQSSGGRGRVHRRIAHCAVTRTLKHD